MHIFLEAVLGVDTGDGVGCGTWIFGFSCVDLLSLDDGTVARELLSSTFFCSGADGVPDNFFPDSGAGISGRELAASGISSDNVGRLSGF